MTASDASEHPPRPTVRLTVGVAAHRRIDPAQVEAIAPQVRAILAEVVACARTAQGRLGAFAAVPAVPVTLLSQLAAGGDQLAAEAALDLGVAVEAVLPFERAVYAQDFGDAGRARLDALIDRAHGVWALPSTRDDEDTAYALAGSLMLGQCDILLALWDGAHARGPGGTGDVVDEAIRRGIPVLHVPLGEGRPPRILWAALEGIGPELLDAASVPCAPLDVVSLARVVDGLLTPPTPPAERQALATYYQEREYRLRARTEYPLLLALAGVRRLSWSHIRVGRYADTTRTEWEPFHTALATAGRARSAGAEVAERAFCWSDRLADHYAQIYRSGTILNYSAAALSVIAALIGLLAPGAKLWLMLIELVLIGSLIANTWIGNRRQWHRRWLDYRYLAEQLRPMRSLMLLGAASAAEAWSVRPRGGGRWTDWYAAAIWREMGLPATIGSGDEVRALAAHVAAHEIQPQIDYHRASATRLHHLDHRLHRAGTMLFVATVLIGILGLVAYLLDWKAVKDTGYLFTVLGAGLPTLGSALYGIRGHNDFAGAARRSIETADRLERSARRLTEDPIDLAVAARVAEDAAATMAANLAEWRTSYQDRKLAIPS